MPLWRPSSPARCHLAPRTTSVSSGKVAALSALQPARNAPTLPARPGQACRVGTLLCGLRSSATPGFPPLPNGATELSPSPHCGSPATAGPTLGPAVAVMGHTARGSPLAVRPAQRLRVGDRSSRPQPRAPHSLVEPSGWLMAGQQRAQFARVPTMSDPALTRIPPVPGRANPAPGAGTGLLLRPGYDGPGPSTPFP